MIDPAQPSSESAPTGTQLPSEFTYWFTFFQKSKDKQMEEFEDNLRKIADFNTAEEFWGIYQHMKRPNTLPRGCEFFLFRKGIKPLWEDEANFGGGRLYLSMKKDVITNKVWEDLQISMIISKDLLPFLCGCVINIRTSEVFISVWIKECSDEKREEIKEWLKKNLELPNTNCIRWKKHPNTEQMVQKQKKLKEEADALKVKQAELERKKEEEAKAKELEEQVEKEIAATLAKANQGSGGGEKKEEGKEEEKETPKVEEKEEAKEEENLNDSEDAVEPENEPEEEEEEGEWGAKTK
jgi:translation initiation factor 4E